MIRAWRRFRLALLAPFIPLDDLASQARKDAHD